MMGPSLSGSIRNRRSKEEEKTHAKPQRRKGKTCTRTVDTIFANTDELLSLYETPHFDEALDALSAEGVLGIVTRSEKGCVVVEGEATWEAPAFPIERLVDTTGAGDMFAAGFLAGLARGRDMTTCGRLGALAAAEIIQHLGARPQVSLKALAAERQLPL
jgi:sugar/nucleoside kinase (ribokinase family)